MINDIVKVIIDRPAGSTHPLYRQTIYPINYGYIEGILAPDGEEQDAYVLGTKEPLSEFTGCVVAVIHRMDDVEDKWVVAPVNSRYTVEEIIKQVSFIEQYFKFEVIV